MSKDLITRLRKTASRGTSVWGDLQCEAADLIESQAKTLEALEDDVRLRDKRIVELELTLRSSILFCNEVGDLQAKQQKEIMTTSKFTVTFPNEYGSVNDRVSVIKALRNLTQLGMYEANIATENSAAQEFTINQSVEAAAGGVQYHFNVLRTNGCVVTVIDQNINIKLRDLIIDAIDSGDLDLAKKLLNLLSKRI